MHYRVPFLLRLPKKVSPDATKHRPSSAAAVSGVPPSPVSGETIAVVSVGVGAEEGACVVSGGWETLSSSVLEGCSGRGKRQVPPRVVSCACARRRWSIWGLSVSGI